MRRDKGKCDIFLEMEHRLRKEEMEEQFNKEAKEGWRCAADAARITDERVSGEDRKHTSRGVFDGSRQQSVSSCESRTRGKWFDSWYRRKNCPGMGECQRRFVCFLGVFPALRRLDHEE